MTVVMVKYSLLRPVWYEREGEGPMRMTTILTTLNESCVTLIFFAKVLPIYQ